MIVLNKIKSNFFEFSDKPQKDHSTKRHPDLEQITQDNTLGDCMVRLDQLLSQESDVQALVAEHLDVRALFRLRKCSRKLGKELSSSERIVRASIQHSFPGVTRFVAGHTFGFYENILSKLEIQVVTEFII